MELSLDVVAAHLEGLEETIIHKLLDRAQFAVNERAYRPGESGFDGEPERSLFALRLRLHEEMDARFGRFCVPEERPFTQDLPTPRRKVTLPDTGLAHIDFNRISVTPLILDSYQKLLGILCPAGDDGQYGSSVEHDVYALQALSRRIHYGALYVAESKYRTDSAVYDSLVAHGDTEAILRRLTRRDVEERIVGRIAGKVDHLQALINPEVRASVAAEVITGFYRDTVIPLTKESEVRYLFLRGGAGNGVHRHAQNEGS
jgi:chorismate mutase